MPRLAILNFVIGFITLAISAASGVFLANDITQGYVNDPAILNAWALSIHSSAHGHTNLFATLHILFGLTMPYSRLSLNVKKFQTIGLSLGTIAMSIGMFLKGYNTPSVASTNLDIGIGVALSCFLVAVLSHGLGLILVLTKR